MVVGDCLRGPYEEICDQQKIAQGVHSVFLTYRYAAAYAVAYAVGRGAADCGPRPSKVRFGYALGMPWVCCGPRSGPCLVWAAERPEWRPGGPMRVLAEESPIRKGLPNGRLSSTEESSVRSAFF